MCYVIYHEHLIDFIKFSVYSVLTLIKILDMQFQDITDGIIEHKEARGFLHLVCWLGDIDKVEDRSKDFVHALNVLHLRVQL
jgi:hypothetical protein